MIRIFAGYDPRESAGFHVFTESLIRTTQSPIAITPINGEQRDGSNSFIYPRFLVPYLCGFQGTAIFMDGSDMLVRSDVAQLAALADPRYAVQVVKHDYRTSAHRKYIGTDMESANDDYPRKNWSSLVIWNCEHPKHRWMEPEAINACSGPFLHRFQWLKDEEIGSLPAEWNMLVGERDEAKIAHFTLGIPAIAEYSRSEYAGEWRDMQNKSLAVPIGSTHVL